MDKINVLITLHKGYGLGDAVQMSAVLRHVAAARSHWNIDYHAEDGFHQVGQNIVGRTFAYGKAPEEYYDAEVQILLYDTWANWHDRPNTRVASCLHERFGLEWNPAYGRYAVHVSEQSNDSAKALLFGNKTSKDRHQGVIDPRFMGDVVAVHYQGVTLPDKKNLGHKQANEICEAIAKLNYRPAILDWKNESPLNVWRITTPRDWGRNAEMVCAVISNCRAFIGIDSGPGKCASATDTPSLIIWTDHHPGPFHDPAPNTTHLVPTDYHKLDPVHNDPGVIAWFEANYNVRHYKNDPVPEVNKWLKEVLK